ncbi:MAG: MotA/TolQ/ExbB proton channel family protein [Halobacteriovoraceae bacterium]|nr:MotA/TolQ/ExbB proton channel family protein [Halobacteriovoraceae bacterium]MCB9095255.1 MotA/TolQ/ExbB proton channel family protein [Halobacteriovoraceae bacterium]
MKKKISALLSTLFFIGFIFLQVGTELNLFLNLFVIFLILGGTTCLSIVMIGLSRLYNTQNVVRGILRNPKVIKKDIILQITAATNTLRINSQRSDPLLIDDEHFHPFLIDGVELLTQVEEHETINDVLEADILARRARHARDIQLIFSVTKYPMICGLLGAILSLSLFAFQLYYHSGSIFTLGAILKMAITFLLYGFAISFFILMPIAKKILYRFDNDIEIRRTIKRGIKLMAVGISSDLIEESLNPGGPDVRMEVH